MFALIDGNNFYVSCERSLRPSLNGRPVCVLSNNDGCCIARSNEAKDLGIAMGAPWFNIRHLEQSAGLHCYSANIALYGDLSDRMMSLAAALGHASEVYSIDESWHAVDGIRDVTRRAFAIRSRILQWVGIPCGVGIGPTKTLAKLANHIAKTAERKPGSYPEDLAQVCNLAAMPMSDLEAIFAATAVDEVWGVGRRIGEQLKADGIHTVLDLARLPPATVRARWSVVLEKTVRELQGQSCITLEEIAAPKREIACTRSFGKPVSELEPLIEAVSTFASRAAEKLRKQHGLAAAIQVFARTSPFRPGPRYARSIVVPLRRPTADTTVLVAAAVSGMKEIYAPGYQIAKAGVMLLDLCDQAAVTQCELDLEPNADRDRSRLMTAMDVVNQRYGKDCLHVASAKGPRASSLWSMKQERLTPQYTTRWADMPIARA